MRCIGQCVVGPGEADRYLKETLDTFKRLCDDVVIATCNATAKEINLIKTYGFWHYEDNREWGRYQPDIKTTLLQKILKLQADWILPLDGDESLPTLTHRELRVLTHSPRDAAFFYVTNLWNDEQHYSKSLSFWNVRFYRADPAKGTQFLRKSLHCGNAPPYFYNQPAKESYVPHILLHKGLMLPADRKRKVQRYAQYDPHAVHKGRDYYDALASNGTGSVYNEAEVLAKIQHYCSTL